MAASAVSSPQPLAFEPADYFQLPLSPQHEPRLSPTQYVLNSSTHPGYSQSVETAWPQWSAPFSASFNSTASNQPPQPGHSALQSFNTANSLNLLSELVTATSSWNSLNVSAPLSPRLRLPLRPYGCPVTDTTELHTEALSSTVESTQMLATVWPSDNSLQHMAAHDFESSVSNIRLTPSSDHVSSATDQSWSQSSDIDWSSFLSQDALSLPNTDSDLGDFELVSSNQSVCELEQQQSDHQAVVADSKEEKKVRRYKIQDSKTKYSKGKPDGMFQTWTLKDKTKKQKSTEAKRKTALNRQLKACPYHQRIKKACDPSCMPYIRCITSTLPTFLYRIDEIRLFRRRPAAGHPLASTRSEIFELKELQDSEAYSHGVTPVTITQDLGLDLKVLVAPFIPQQDDKTKHIWYDGDERKEIPMLPFCLAHLPTLRQNLLEYIRSSVWLYLHHIMQGADSLTKSILLNAQQFAMTQQSSLVQGALHLLAVSRMIEFDWRISGPETLGHSPNLDIDCPWFGKVPVTPMMDTHLDQIIIQDFLNPLRTKVLDELQRKMYSSAKERCYEIFLTTFILTTNTQLLLRHSRNNAIRYRAKSRYNSISLAEEYIDGHNVLLAHFHYFCSDTVLSSNPSASKSNKTQLIPADQLYFMQQMKSLLDMQKVMDLRESKLYESELYWSHQLFLKNWVPESTKIVAATV